MDSFSEAAKEISRSLDAFGDAVAEAGQGVRRHPRGCAALLFIALSFAVFTVTAGPAGFVLCLMIWLAAFASGGSDD